MARELSIFADESGADGLDSRYYLLTLVLHEQDKPYLQQFDLVKLYYDGGQHAVTQALHDALEYALSREAVVYRSSTAVEYRLSQAADYACAVELAAPKYKAHEETATDRRFFGSWQAFKRNVLKTVRKKAL